MRTNSVADENWIVLVSERLQIDHILIHFNLVWLKVSYQDNNSSKLILFYKVEYYQVQIKVSHHLPL